MLYQHFTSDERDALQVMINRGVDAACIARILEKHSSSIYRELDRNAIHWNYYLSAKAHSAASTRRKDTKPQPTRENRKLMRDIESRFILDHSPEQIAGRLKRDHPDDPTFHVSHETIYQYLYARQLEDPELCKHFRHGHAKRRKRLSGKDMRGSIPNRHFIDERPAIVEEKTRIGDWEGDTVEGGGKKGYIATFVDRHTKYLVACCLANKTAKGLVHSARKAFRTLPAECRKTATVDNGKEFAAHRELAIAIGADVYFAHPYHSWERGLNEHTNGLLRQYFPKKQPLNTLTSRELDRAVKKINTRPRKSLGYLTPQEVFSTCVFALQI